APATAGGLTNGDAQPIANENAATANGTAAEDPKPAPAAPPAPKDPQAEKIDKLKNRVTFTKDGKKRIAPLLLSSNQSESNMPKPQLQASVRSGIGSDEPAGKILDLSKPYDGLPKCGLASLLLGNKRKFAEVEGDTEEERKRAEKRVQAVQQTGATPVVNNTENGLVPAGSGSAVSKKLPLEVPDVLRPAVLSPALSVSQTRLAVPLVRSTILRPLDASRAPGDEAAATSDGTADDANVVFEARNASGPSRTGRAQDREPTRITLSKRNQN
ncbi:hypothetical protein KC318_g21750, partial [Hortaea werneckii]